VREERMDKLRHVLAVVVLLILGFGARASADPVGVQFTVRVTTSHGDLETVFGTPIHPGDVMQGNLVYDPAGVPDGGTSGQGYDVPGTVTIGTHNNVALPLQGIFIFDDRSDLFPDGHDSFGTSGLSTTMPGFNMVETVLELNSPVSGGGTGIPRTAAAFRARFESGPFRFIGVRPEDSSEDPSLEIFGLASLRGAAQTPEPATLLLLGSGACVVMTQRRKLKSGR
jgi:hypothetical protein